MTKLTQADRQFAERVARRITAGEAERAIEMLRHRADLITSPDSFTYAHQGVTWTGSLLRAAIQACNGRMVAWLLENGAPVKDAYGSIIPWAAWAASPSALETMLKAGGDPNAADKGGIRPLGNYSTVAHLRALLKAGADVTVPVTKNGSTALHMVTSIEAARLLVAAGADLHARNRVGLTPTATAQTAGIRDVLLSAGGDPNVVVDDRGNTPLHLATSLESVAAFLAAGANPNARNFDGNTPLHLTDTPQVAAALIKAGADVNATNRVGESRLHHCTGAVASVLVAAGAKLDLANISRQTPLYLAIQRGELQLAHLLVASGAAVQAEASDRTTPLQLAQARAGLNPWKRLVSLMETSMARSVQGRQAAMPAAHARGPRRGTRL